MRRPRVFSVLPYVALVVVHTVLAEGPLPKPSAADILSQSRARYAALTSYSDTGSLLIESGSAQSLDKDRRSFFTYYHAPRQFLMSNKKADTGEELVLWCEGEDFKSWWTASKTVTNYPRGEGAIAFANAAYPTSSAAVMIPSWLFAGAGLQGPLSSFNLSRDAGEETLNGNRTYKLVGEEAQAYGTGNVTGARTITIWIDARTFLIRKVFEDTPHDSAAGAISRQTTTFEPLANPTLDAARFHYVPPAEAKR